jgi:hypothetical protein
MAMDRDLQERVKACKWVLEGIVDGEQYYAAALVRNGHIIRDSILGTPRIDLVEEVRKAEHFLAFNGTGQNFCYQLVVTLSQRKICFLHLNDPSGGDQYWLLVTMDVGRLYVVRAFRKVAKKLKILLLENLKKSNRNWKIFY